MKEKFRLLNSFLAIFLSVILLCSSLPMSVLARTFEDRAAVEITKEETEKTDKNERNFSNKENLIEQNGLHFNSATITRGNDHQQIADLLKGEIPHLKSSETYFLNISYLVPESLKDKPTYFKLYFNNGLYVKALDGATFKPGPIESTGFGALLIAPTGTGTAPYGYPNNYFNEEAFQRKSGTILYESRYQQQLDQVATGGKIQFTVDEAFENQDPEQVFKDAITIALGDSKSTQDTDVHHFNVVASDTPSCDFYAYPAESTEMVSKGAVTNKIKIGTSGAGNNKSLTQPNTKTVIQLIYPKDIELESLEETAVYETDGTIEKIEEEGENKVATVSWAESGSYSTGISIKPHLRIPKDSPRPNGDSFFVKVRNYSKSIWNEKIGRTSLVKEGKLKVTILDGEIKERIVIIPLNDYGINWSKEKYDTYNVRLGNFTLTNKLSIPTTPKTLKIDLDKKNTAIIRGVTVPYQDGMEYGKIKWKSASGKEGIAEPSSIIKRSTGALIKNTNLGLDIDDSIKSIELDIGSIPASYNGFGNYEEELNGNFININAVAFTSYSTIGVFGAWKEGTNADVVTEVTLSDTDGGDKIKVLSSSEEWKKTSFDQYYTTTHTIKGLSHVPVIRNGSGKMTKTQINGGESFDINGNLIDNNWNWNPLQEPILYVIMPEGFRYSELKIKNGKLSEPEYIGNFTDRKGIGLDVWKYSIDIGKTTKGLYSSDFSEDGIPISMHIDTDKRAAVGNYHINDFIGFSTKEYKKIAAELGHVKWTPGNWETSQYTKVVANHPEQSYDVFEGKVNDGFPMVSVASDQALSLMQPIEVVAMASFVTIDADGQRTEYIYNPKEAEKTIAFLKEKEKATVHIAVRNNTTATIENVSLFVPLFKDGLDFGPSFMPNGPNQLPLNLLAVKYTPNFTAQYIKLKDGKQYSKNKAPEPGDYEVVKDASEANMMLFTAKKALAVGNGGSIDMTYTLPENLSYQFHQKKDVITPVLDYNLHGNKSTQTKEAMAVGAELTEKDTPWTPLEPAKREVKVTKVWKGIEANKAPAVKVYLLKNGEKTEQFVELSANNKWSGKFANLPVSDKVGEGKTHVYTVAEEKVEGYETQISGDMNNGFIITNILKKDEDKRNKEDKQESVKSSVENIGKSKVENLLNIKDHYAYLFGYKDFSFRPDNDMTRAEAAAMFSRLMKNYPNAEVIYNLPYSDVKRNDWYYLAVGYLNEEGIIKGYPDGTFRPNNKITRAEFAAIASRFDQLSKGYLEFSDVKKTYWAYNEIKSAAMKGWVKGYPDETFKPDRDITRAEVTTITNHMLNREADRNYVDIHEKQLVVYNDVKDHWAYYDIEEATNGHDYHRKVRDYEIWEKLNHKAFLFSVEGRDTLFTNVTN